MSGSIKAIDTDSVHRIHSGQVVLDLQGAIKELVENSLDAEATTIDVRIKDNGLDSIEISDNGSGIAESDWESIALKHHTSKLPSLTDLYKVTTFGFRGEALSALCALCESVTIVTSTKETAPMGAIIQLGRDGRVIDSTGRIARPRGTTITLTGLFVPLPVRRKEFERTVKRELTKALTLLTAYALVPASVSLPGGRNGVRLKVETIAAGKSGKRNVQLATDGRGSLRASVGSVWGHKALEGVQDVDLTLDVEIDRVMARREGITDTTQSIKVVGLISSAQWGQGRSSADRQFYFINGRPCNLTTVARAINEVYKSFNTHQVPLAILDFQIPPQSVDINVSPDKRTIFVHSEDKLIEALKIALDEFFQPSRSTFAVGGATQTVKNIRQNQSQLTQFGQPSTDTEDADKQIDVDEGGHEVEQKRSDDDVVGLDSNDEGMNLDHEIARDTPHTRPSSRRRSSPIIQIDTESDDGDEPSSALTQRSHASRPSRSSRSGPVFASPPSVSRQIKQTLSTTKASWSPNRKIPASARAGPGPSTRNSRLDMREKLKAYASQASAVDGDDSEEQPDDQVEEHKLLSADDHDGDVNMEEDELVSVTSERTVPDGDEEAQQLDDREDSQDIDGNAAQSIAKRGRSPGGSISDQDQNGGASPLEDMTRAGEDTDQSVEPEHDPDVERDERPSTRRKTSSYRDEITTTTTQGEIKLSFNLPRLRSRYAMKQQEKSRRAGRVMRDAYSKVREGGLTSAAGISNKNMQLAEEALSRVISKDDFNKMEVLGQFNKGFIIARLTHPPEGTDDLFIIDQHASDEKYNFETLQRTTVIKGQSLIKPRPLQLTAGDEIVAMENLDILSKNGFDVKVDEDALPGRGERINLISMPVSKETTFDFKDLEQLLHMLSDGSRTQGQMVRCTKARSMFAMRACRKSVMIGKSLTKNQMINLLRNMGTIDQPWNCPHGRPTMRHLTKIDQPTKSRSGAGRIDWKKWKRQQGIRDL
uniref:DNA mismatch repair protein PMS2 n=1 Tax=Kwoniella dejecticola CBS 10117 TaxID=1296121 RepID=A0A1A6AHA7_9TREE|nr:uncharacterized protein I303_01225 [Kwoniella dejecticola CBS 10117]OBR89398.1 hypothetical protein I303_01225 [Kwoniella dejecticola CBS 10117]